jgi:hypothetical protein
VKRCVVRWTFPWRGATIKILYAVVASALISTSGFRLCLTPECESLPLVNLTLHRTFFTRHAHCLCNFHHESIKFTGIVE